MSSRDGRARARAKPLIALRLTRHERTTAGTRPPASRNDSGTNFAWHARRIKAFVLIYSRTATNLRAPLRVATQQDVGPRMRRPAGKNERMPDARRRASPRTPSRGRGIARYEVLLDSVDALLQESNPDDVGLYQIAQHAGVPPASVYHFFPTKEAACLALAQRYLKGFAALSRLPVPKTSLESWQNLMAWDLDQGIDYYHRHSPAMKLFLGRFGGIETQQANVAHNARIARSTYGRLDAAFHMPYLRDAEKYFHINIEIIDAVLTLSYLKHGHVTGEYRNEALRASVAYCRLFLPERTELRDEHVRAIRRSEPVVLRAPHSEGDD